MSRGECFCATCGAQILAHWQLFEHATCQAPEAQVAAVQAEGKALEWRWRKRENRLSKWRDRHGR